jgi:hypothetical protein
MLVPHPLFDVARHAQGAMGSQIFQTPYGFGTPAVEVAERHNFHEKRCAKCPAPVKNRRQSLLL